MEIGGGGAVRGVEGVTEGGDGAGLDKSVDEEMDKAMNSG